MAVETPLLPGTAEPADGGLPDAYVYRPPRSAMQSGTAHTGEWILEFEPASRLQPEPLMGWSSTRDPFGSMFQLRFIDRQSAIDFAERHGWTYLVRNPPPRHFRPKRYADNFR